MENNWTIDEVLNHPKLSDDFKFNYLEELFETELTEDKVEYVSQEFKKWRANNIKSSNVKKIMYEDETKEMTIQFQDKSIYTYFEVPFDLFLDVSGGNAVCITSGENKYGRWWIGKSPSVGSAVHKFLVKKQIKYKKGGNFR
jgi:hypothetical protein